MALVLARRAGTSLVLKTPEGHRIVITVAGLDRFGEIKLAIDAPRDIEILRSELLEAPAT